MSNSSDKITPISLWRNRDYLLLWSGQALSAIGGSVSELAFPLLVLAVTGSPAQAGIAAGLRALPMIFYLIAGAIIDRWDRKRVMIFCDLGRFLSLASIPLALSLGVLTIWQLYFTAFIEGTLVVFFSLAHSSSLGKVVSQDQFPAAIAQEELMEGTTALIGPTLSGALFTLGRMIPFVVDALTYGISLITLVLIRTPFQEERKQQRKHLFTEIRDGIAWMWGQPVIRDMTLINILAASLMPGSMLAVIVLAQERHASPLFIGLIFACGGVGSILGSMLSPFFQKRLRLGQAILVCRWLIALFCPLYIVFPYPLLMGIPDFGIGFVDPIEDVPYFSYRLAVTPDELRGRVISTSRLFMSLTRPLGLALTGWLLQIVGGTTTLLIISAGLVVVALCFTLSKPIRTA